MAIFELSILEGGHEESRREFLKHVGIMLGGITILSTIPLVESCSSNSTPSGILADNSAGIMVVDVSSLTTDGTTLVTPHTAAGVGPDGATIIIYRQSAGVFQAHSMRCTHAGCLIGDPSGGTMNCPCHGSQFDLTGNVLHGPAGSPLASYGVSYSSTTNQLTINLKSLS